MLLLFRQPCVQFSLQATCPLKDYPRNMRACPGEEFNCLPTTVIKLLLQFKCVIGRLYRLKEILHIKIALNSTSSNRVLLSIVLCRP